jgi:hypothetical protein
MRVPSRRLVNHQQVLILKYDARHHAQMKAQIVAMQNTRVAIATIS